MHILSCSRVRFHPIRSPTFNVNFTLGEKSQLLIALKVKVLNEFIPVAFQQHNLQRVRGNFGCRLRSFVGSTQRAHLVFAVLQ